MSERNTLRDSKTEHPAAQPRESFRIRKETCTICTRDAKPLASIADSDDRNHLLASVELQPSRQTCVMLLLLSTAPLLEYP
jgi:hypothetical protein